MLCQTGLGVLHARVGSALLLLAFLAPATLRGATCDVPTGSHPTLGAAVRDLACTTIQLAAGTFPENVVLARDLAIEGGGSALSIVTGTFEVSGAASGVTLAGLSLDGTAAGVAGCWTSLLRTTGGARLESIEDVRVTNSGISSGPCRLFADGFESAGMLAWSNRVP